MGHHLLFWGYILSCLSAKCFYGAIQSFSVTEGQTLQGNSVKIVCELTESISAIYIYKTPTKNINGVSYLASCGKLCSSADEQLYNVTKTERALTVTVMKLKRTTDQRWWTCRSTSNEEQQFYLTVYTQPKFLELSSINCDLANSKCTLSCTTSCMYPRPTFSWYYSDTAPFKEYNDGNRMYENKTISCSEWEGQATEILTLSRYTTLPENTDTTVVLKCSIPFFTSERVLESNASSRIRYAVQVQQVKIYSNQSPLPPNYKVIVTENIETSLRCIAEASRPPPRITLHIGTNDVIPVTGDKGTFTPSNLHHDAFAYCKAENFIGTGTAAATSNIVKIYVKVPIKFVYIKPVADTLISVIENTSVPVVCTTSAGRPGATIKWYRNNVELNDGDSTNFEITNNNLNVTKSTRYVNVLRSDSGWTLSCSASNFEGSTPIWANNSKQWNVLYPPEHMSLLFDEKPVIGFIIDVIKGTPGILKCTAPSNPPVSVFSWNINQKVGDTLTLDDKIRNGQIVNCTARNIMTPTTGITMNGYKSISKKINLQYGAYIERIEVNGNTGSEWVFKEKDPILIACYVDSNPDSTISLFQGGNLLMEKRQNAILIYNISSAQCNHTSQYICQAGNGITNVEQPASRAVQINVECSPRLASETNSLIFAKENTTAVLFVTVLAYPIPTHHSWYRNNSNRWEELRNTPALLMTQASLQFLLIIIQVTPEDFGEYKLTVDNRVGDPPNFTFVLQQDDMFSSNCFHTDARDDASKVSAVAGAMGTVIAILVIIVVIWALFIWRNHIGFMCQNKDNSNYEMPNRPTQGSSEDRTYDTVSQGYSEYENSAP